MAFDPAAKAILRNMLEHIGLGLLLMAVAAPLAGWLTGSASTGVWIAWVLQCGFWWGHETRDNAIHKQAAAGRPPTNVEYIGAMLPWTFNPDGRRDLFAPVVVNGLLAWMVLYGI